MTTVIEHINDSPGLADGICPRHCSHLLWLFGVATCTAFSSGLKQDESRNPIRCCECVGDSNSNGEAMGGAPLYGAATSTVVLEGTDGKGGA